MIRQLMRGRMGGGFMMRNDLPDPPPRYNLNADPDDAEQDRINNRMVAEQLLMEGRHHATNRLRSDEPRDAIDAALSLLEFSRRQSTAPVSRIEVFERLMELPWERKPKESTAQMIHRLTVNPLLEAQQNELEEGLLIENYRDNYLAQLAPRYEEAAGSPWPFDWRSNEKAWTDLLVQIVESKGSEDIAAYWKTLIAKDPAQADWRRSAYVAAVRHSHGKLDLDVLGPWTDPRPKSDPAQIALLGELIQTVSALSPDEEDAQRAELRRRFLAELARLPLSDAKFDERVAGVLVEMHQQDVREGRDAVAQILAHESPWPFYRLVSELAMDSGAAQRMMQGRPIKVAFRERPLAEAVAELEAKVVLPLWIDDEVRGSQVKVTLERQGPWLDLLDATLEPAGFRAVFMPHHVLWIGPAAKAAAARTFYSEALARTQGAHNQLTYQFQAGNDSYGGDEVTEWKFDQQPLSEVLAHIRETTSLSIDCPEEAVRQAKVTFRGRDLPLSLVIALIARSAGAEWDTIGLGVVLGTPKKMAELRELVQKHERRMAMLATRTDRVSKALREASGTSASDTHLADLLSFMQQSHEIGVGYFTAASGPSPEKPMSMESRESWAWDLDVLSFQVSLAWDYCPDGVWLAEPSKLAKIAAIVAARTKEKPADEARQTLAGVVTFKIDNKTLSEIKPNSDEGETLDTKLDFSRLPAETQKRKFCGAFAELPLAIALDLIAAECDARWELAGDTVRFLPAP